VVSWFLASLTTRGPRITPRMPVVPNYKQSIYAFLNLTCGSCGLVCPQEQLSIRDLNGRPRPRGEQYKGFLKKVYNSLVAQDGEQGGYCLWCEECVGKVRATGPQENKPAPPKLRTISAWEQVARVLGRLEVLTARCEVVGTHELTDLVNLLRGALRRQGVEHVPPVESPADLPEGRSVPDAELERRLARLEESEE